MAKELARLARLVDSRAVAAVRIESRGLVGLTNPRTLREGLLLPAVGFRLAPCAPSWGMTFEVWDPVALGSEPEARCLGGAVPVLAWNLSMQDPFGLVDTVLNFLETNDFARPVAQWRRTGRWPRLRRALGDLF